MKYQQFGRISDRVSRFGMGCMRLPQTRNEQGNDVIDEAEAIRMIRHAVDNGVNYFDTAYAYPGSEAVLGRALKGGRREKVMIATKCPMHEIHGHVDYRRVLEASLRRLDTDYVDVYLFHCLDRKAWDKVLGTDGIAFMEAMKREGKIKAIAFSFHAEHALFTEIVDAYAWDMCLIQLNILDRIHQAGVAGLRYAGRKGIPVAIMEPLKGGLLGSEPPEEVTALLQAHPERRTLVEWSFRWLCTQPEVTVILSGVSSMAQLEDNLRIFDASEPHVWTDADETLVDQINSVYGKRVRVGCTGCGYCMPCPQGVNIPEIFKIYNDASLSDWDLYGQTYYNLVAISSNRDASRCVGCRLCESRCPQGIAIVETLMAAHGAMKAG